MRGAWLVAVAGLGAAVAEPVLRYSSASCNTLEPAYREENWQQGANTADTDTEMFSSARRSRQRVPPFQILLDFDQYRRNRKYTVRIVAEDNRYFDSFLLQARGGLLEDGNTSLVGSWCDMPSIAAVVPCPGQGEHGSTVADRGRPVQLHNLTFTWRSPPADHGDIRFTASLVSNDEYLIIESREISFNTFPVSIRGCGRTVSCFRQCGAGAEHTCPVDTSNYVAVWSYDPATQLAAVSMGARVANLGRALGMDGDTEQEGDMTSSNMTYFVAMGFGMDKKSHKMMDVTACHLEPNSSRVVLGHYLLEAGTLYTHKAPLSPATWDQDAATGFVWCNFSRPLLPSSLWELDLSLRLYQFYFIGTVTDTGLHMPKDRKNVWDSKMKQNFTRITNAIEYSYSFLGPKPWTKNDASMVKFGFSFIHLLAWCVTAKITSQY